MDMYLVIVRLSRLALPGAVLALAGGVFAKPFTLQAPTQARLPHGDAVKGARLYQSCMGCHSIDDNDVGPKHRGVVGRRAGSVTGYTYSPALKASGIVWTPIMIDRWLQGPAKLVPGTKMYFSIAKAQDRADIITYLATQK